MVYNHDHSEYDCIIIYSSYILGILTKPVFCENENTEDGSILPSPACSKNFCGRNIQNSSSAVGSSAFIAVLGVTEKRNEHLVQYICGGALINRRYVVSAATCHDEEKHPIVEVRMGGFTLSKPLGKNSS